MRLGEILKANNLIEKSEGAVAQALKLQTQSKGRLGSILIELGLANHDTIATALSKQHQVPAALTKHFKNTDKRAIDTITPSLANEFKAVPFAFATIGNERKLVVCCRDPLDLNMVNALNAHTSMSIYPVVAPERSVFSMLEKCFGIKIDDNSMSPQASAGKSDDHGFQLAMLDDEFVNKTTQKYQAPPAMASQTPSPLQADPKTSQPSLGSQSTPASTHLDKQDSQKQHTHLTYSLKEAKEKIELAPSRDHIVEALFGFLRTFASSAVLLQIKDDIALGYKGYGENVDTSSVESIVLPLSAESMVAKCIKEKREIFGNKQKSYSQIESRFLSFFPTQYILRGCAPIAIQNRIVMAIYMHGDDLGVHKEEILDLLSAFSTSVLRLIKASKKTT